MIVLLKNKAPLPMLLALPLMAASVRIYQTNAGGDEVDVIDTGANKVVFEVKDIEVPHGVTFSPDGSRAYITCESENTVWATDTKPASSWAKANLSGHPNNLSVTKDGKRLFIAIVTAPAASMWSIRTRLRSSRTIPTRAACTIHSRRPTANTSSADPLSERFSTHRLEHGDTFREHKFDLGVRPIGIRAGAPMVPPAAYSSSFLTSRLRGPGFQNARKK